MEQALIEKIVRLSFGRGENWGVTYSTWFTPSKEQGEERIHETIRQVNDIINKPREDLFNHHPCHYGNSCNFTSSGELV